GLALLFYKLFKWEKLLVNTQLIMILVIPTVLQWSLGGFQLSGVVCLWSSVAPFGAIIFQSSRKAVFWVLSYLILLSISFYFDSDLMKLQTSEISSNTKLFFFGMNLIGTSFVTFGAIFYYNKNLMDEKLEKESFLNSLNLNIDLLLNSIDKFSVGDLTGKVSTEAEDESQKKLIFGYNTSLDLIKTLVEDLRDKSFNVHELIMENTQSLRELEDNVHLNSDKFKGVDSNLKNLILYLGEVNKLIVDNENITRDNKELALFGGQTLKEAVGKFEDVKKSFEETDEMVKHLEKVSLEIGEITSSINEISESTNLLALNASIEAARAGVHGRGFSVVAKEIGNLTNSTTDATQKINNKIKEIKSKTKLASSQFSKSNELILTALDSLRNMEFTMNEMIQYSEKSSSNIEKIASETEKEIKLIKEDLNKLLGVLDGFNLITDKIDEIYHESDTMKKTANQMIERIEKFKVI
ncbi:MAG: methyl-accepting chemotaxis protein, partial [Leptospiraceae bacterium]|nr:methyl-accepting chemotaxis protein [Leptospiraceae bacterium]